jgi:hypothetical protein
MEKEAIGMHREQFLKEMRFRRARHAPCKLKRECFAERNFPIKTLHKFF